MAFGKGVDGSPRWWRAVALLGLVSLLSVAAPGQDVPLYRIGVGDVVEVIVQGEPTLSAPGPTGLTVGPDGRIGLPYAGLIAVDGLTCEEAAAAVADALTPKYLLDPSVLVRIVAYRSRIVSVTGAVKSPGTFPHTPGLTVRRAVALAGGVIAATGGLTPSVSGRVIRADATVVDVGLEAVLRGDDAEGNISLAPGDTLDVRIEMGADVTILGAVKAPGAYPLVREARVTDMLARAGGPAERADLSSVSLNRGAADPTICDIGAVLEGAGGENPLVAPGDLIYVGTLIESAVIMGRVREPGKYEFSEGDRISALVAQAKGSAPGDEAGDLSRIRIVHADGTTATADLTQAGLATDPLLQPGDLVSVPPTDLFVTVTGYVTNQGQYRFSPGDTVRTAIAGAGGVSPLSGSLSDVRVRRRDGTEQSLDAEVDDPELQPGDEVVVGKNQNRIAVIGQVAQPDVYEFDPGDTVIDAIARAGGPERDRTLGYKIVRGHPHVAFLYREVDGVQTGRQLDFRRFLKEGDLSANPALEPGDIIVVPRKGKLDSEGLLRDLLLIPRALDSLFGD